ncbi:MAG: hypothetical protein VW547_05925 [Alphaproteobacteria bacterium]
MKSEIYANLAVAAILFAMPATAVQAREKYPSLSGDVSFEVQDDWTYESDDRSKLNNDLYPTIEPSVKVHFTPEWSAVAHVTIESIGDPAKFENRFFEDVGLYVDELYGEYAGERLSVKAGKLNAGFGVGWDAAAGLFGTDFAEDYETSERVGVFASWRLSGGENGSHRVWGGTFFKDTTILSESALRGRGDTRRGDGGIGNTESFDNFIVAIDGEKIPFLGEAGYHFSVMGQSAGVGGTSDETSVAAAVFTNLDVGHGITLTSLLEGVRISHAGGTATEDKEYVVLSGQLAWNSWNLALAHTWRATKRDSAADHRDTHFQVSAGYAFDFGLSIDVGWKVVEEAKQETQTVGIKAGYTIPF